MNILTQMNISLGSLYDKQFSCFTDGSCIHNGKKNAKASWAVIFPDNEELNNSGIVEIATNNRAEITAIINAIHIAKNFSNKPLYIYSDSQYVIKSMTIWIKKWKLNGWLTLKKKPVENKDLFLILDKLIQQNSIHFIWCKSHTDKNTWESINNDKVDKLAKFLLL
jgi:ribonuclease HI